MESVEERENQNHCEHCVKIKDDHPNEKKRMLFIEFATNSEGICHHPMSLVEAQSQTAKWEILTV